MLLLSRLRGSTGGLAWPLRCSSGLIVRLRGDDWIEGAPPLLTAAAIFFDLFVPANALALVVVRLVGSAATCVKCYPTLGLLTEGSFIAFKFG